MFDKNLEKVRTIDARSNIAEMVNFVAFGGRKFILTRRGKPMAAIVSISDLRLIEKYEVIEKAESMHGTLEEPAL